MSLDHLYIITESQKMHNKYLKIIFIIIIEKPMKVSIVIKKINNTFTVYRINSDDMLT